MISHENTIGVKNYHVTKYFFHLLCHSDERMKAIANPDSSNEETFSASVISYAFGKLFLKNIPFSLLS